MRMLKVIIAAGVLAVGFLALTTSSQAKPAYSKAESKPCTFCHVKAGSKDLNDAGKYYKQHKSLTDYKAPVK